MRFLFCDYREEWSLLFREVLIRMYTPEGYLNDPPDAKCPYCGKSKKACSYVNSLSRSWERDACKKKHNIKFKNLE